MTRKIGKTKESVAKPGKRISLSRRTPKTVLAKLSHRVTDLILTYVKVGRLTPGLRREVFRLKDDVDTWRARARSDDIRATQSVLVRRPGQTARKAMTKPGRRWCDCEPVTIDIDEVCFLVECEEGTGWTACKYMCFHFPTNHARQKRKRRPSAN